MRTTQKTTAAAGSVVGTGGEASTFWGQSCESDDDVTGGGMAAVLADSMVSANRASVRPERWGHP